MENLIKYNKIWLTKDKYIYRSGLGEHWFLKKYLILYKYFLVKRRTIDKELVSEIINEFQKYIDYYKNDDIKKECELYFFSPVDIRKFNTLINFEMFNNVEDLDDAARKCYLVYLMGIGMQSGIKKGIGDLLYSNKDITVQKILDSIPNIKNEAIKEKKSLGKIVRSKNDSIYTIFSDFHAEIRNYRQLLSNLGILPPEEDGYEMNEISNLICESDPILTMAIWEHQKIKLRYSNLYTRPTHEKEIEKYYNSPKDFVDFNVNPYLALIEILYKLLKHDKESAYISFNDYKYYICREAPFNTDVVIKKILYFRSLSENDKNKISTLFNLRPKTRNFSKDKPKSTSEDFLKELSNFIYGISSYKFIEQNSNYYITFLDYKDEKIVITDYELFEKFALFVLNFNKILFNKYDLFYNKISDYCSLKMIDEVVKDSTKDEEFLKKLSKIRKSFINNESIESINSFYNNTIIEWKNYIGKIDPEILVLCYSYVIAIQDTNNLIKTQDSLFISEKLGNITAYDNKYLKEFIFNTSQSFHSKDNIPFGLISKIPTHKVIFDEQEISNEINNSLRRESYSTLKQKIKKEQDDLMYIYEGDHRQRQRNIKMMILTQKLRFEKSLIMEEVRPDYPVLKCDICDIDFKKGEPECHHLIPFEIYGPDSPFNYIFLCNNCHKVFTHKTLARKRYFSILKLKEKGVIQRKYFEKMIKDGDLIQSHIKFLHHEGYIHTVDYMELLKMLKATKLYNDGFDSFLKKTFPSKDRWNRAMKMVYFNRIKHHLIMENIEETYDVYMCDSCKNKFDYEEPECHHIVPKKIKGPETPYNYTYLCKQCHGAITYNSSLKKDVIVNLVKNKIVSIYTLSQMIVTEEINREHLGFLFSEGYIDEDLNNELVNLIERVKYYRGTINNLSI